MNEETAALLTRTATLLLCNGQTTEGTRIAVESLAEARGCPVKFTARWGEFVIQAVGRTMFGQTAPVAVDIGRVVATEAVVETARAAGSVVGDELARLEAVGRSPPVALVRFVPMAAAGAAALGVIFGAAGWPTLGLIAMSAGCGALLRRLVSRASDSPLLQPLTAAVLAGLVGGLAVRFNLPVQDRLVVVCPCMVLVPGPHFLNGGLDLARARIPMGAGRIGFAFMIVLAICTGLLVGLAATGVAFPQAGSPYRVALGYDVLAAGVAVAAYGSFFNTPWRFVAAPVLVGMAAHAVRWQMLEHGASLQAGAFGAALFAGAAIAPLSHGSRLPFGASAFSAVVSLIPGVLMFDAASATVAAIGQVSDAGSASLLPAILNGATALIVLFTLAAGLIIPKMAFDAWLWRGRQREA